MKTSFELLRPSSINICNIVIIILVKNQIELYIHFLHMGRSVHSRNDHLINNKNNSAWLLILLGGCQLSCQE